MLLVIGFCSSNFNWWSLYDFRH